MRALCAALVVATGCGEPAIDVSLRLPDSANGAEFDMSCVKSVRVYAIGNEYPADQDDFESSCIPVDGAATFADVKAQLAGELELALPDTGLQGIGVFGRGDGGCEIPEDSPGFYDADAPPLDTAFQGQAFYDDGSSIAIPLAGTMSCETTMVRAAPVDMLKLIATKDCAMAKSPDGVLVGTGTIYPLLPGFTVWSGGFTRAATTTGGLATFDGHTVVGPNTCLGLHTETGPDEFTSSCHIPGPACSDVGTLEPVMLPIAPINNSLDGSKMALWHAALFGLVWQKNPGTTTGAPVQGATVTVSPDLGEVVYAEPTPAGDRFVPTNGTATGPSGTFIVYTNFLAPLKIDGAGTSRTVTVTATPFEPATAIVVLK
jgi:hypothetical protein